MNLSICEGNLRPCVFILTVLQPPEALKDVMLLLYKRGIRVASLYFHVDEAGEGSITIYCGVERDRVAYIGRQMEKLIYVMELEWMIAQTRNRQY